jgi:hypothetical protein
MNVQMAAVIGNIPVFLHFICLLALFYHCLKKMSRKNIGTGTQREDEPKRLFQYGDFNAPVQAAARFVDVVACRFSAAGTFVDDPIRADAAPDEFRHNALGAFNGKLHFALRFSYRGGMAFHQEAAAGKIPKGLGYRVQPSPFDRQ